LKIESNTAEKKSTINNHPVSNTNPFWRW